MRPQGTPGRDRPPDNIRFKVESLGPFEHRVGLTIPLELDEVHFALALLPERGTPAAENGDIVFHACNTKCEKLIRKMAIRALRNVDLSPVAQ